MPDSIRQRHVILLQGDVGPVSQATLLSNHLMFSYVLDEIVAYFEAGTDNLLQLYPLLADDDSTSTSGLPQGLALLSPFAPTSHIAADNAVIRLDIDLDVPRRSSWLKCHVVNLDSFPHYLSIAFSLSETFLPPRGSND